MSRAPQLPKPGPATPGVALDPKLATYSRDGLLTYPASAWRGRRLVAQA
jgi:hypothetical protein